MAGIAAADDHVVDDQAGAQQGDDIGNFLAPCLDTDAVEAALAQETELPSLGP